MPCVGAFWEPKSIKQHICHFLIVDEFPYYFCIVVVFGRVPCSSYIGSFFGSFFCIEFYSDLGDVLDPFGSRHRTLLASICC